MTSAWGKSVSLDALSAHPMIGKLLIPFIMAVGTIWTFALSAMCLAASVFSTRAAFSIMRAWAKGWCALTRVDVRVEGLENLPPDRAMVLAPNHTSMFDIFVLLYLPVRFYWILKRELALVPLLGWAIAAMGHYWVRRDGTGKDLAVMKRVEEGLRSGKSILVFPEGTRSRTGELLPFKKGPFRLAQHSGAPLVPVALIGTGDISPPGRLPERLGHDVTIRVGRPITIGPAEPLDAVMARFREALVGLLKEGSASTRG